MDKQHNLILVLIIFPCVAKKSGGKSAGIQKKTSSQGSDYETHFDGSSKAMPQKSE